MDFGTCEPVVDLCKRLRARGKEVRVELIFCEVCEKNGMEVEYYGVWSYTPCPECGAGVHCTDKRIRLLMEVE